MKTILSSVLMLTASINFVFAGTVKADSHTEVLDGAINQMMGIMTQMSKIANAKDAEAFAKTIPQVKAKMKSLLSSAQALPAPTEAEKLAFAKRMDEAEKKAGPAMMQMMMGLAENPDAEAIAKALTEVMEDKELKEVADALEAIYETDKTKGGACPTPPKLNVE